MPDNEKRITNIISLPASTSLAHAFGHRRVALYCRVSSKMERQLDSLSAQKDFEKQDIMDLPFGNMSAPTPTSAPAAASRPVPASNAS